MTLLRDARYYARSTVVLQSCGVCISACFRLRFTASIRSRKPLVKGVVYIIACFYLQAHNKKRQRKTRRKGACVRSADTLLVPATPVSTPEPGSPLHTSIHCYHAARIRRNRVIRHDRSLGHPLCIFRVRLDGGGPAFLHPSSTQRLSGPGAIFQISTAVERSGWSLILRSRSMAGLSAAAKIVEIGSKLGLEPLRGELWSWNGQIRGRHTLYCMGSTEIVGL